jgi:hypothetical protein
MLQTDAYMIPSKVYVGDRASLVVPLPGVVIDAEISLEHISASADIIIHRAALERRPTGSFLTIEFSAYTPGTLELPSLNIAGETFTGLKIEISSILAADESETVLSAPALPLAIPGTSLLIYGTMGTAILLTLLTVWVLFWGRKRLRSWITTWKRRLLLIAMRGTEKRLHKALMKGAPHREILDILSAEFRNFLAHFTGENYRAMTAAEIGGLEAGNSAFLGSLFGRCDRIRFSGTAINRDETFALLDDVRRFLAETAA